MLADPLLIIV
jgi:succinate dehydrogenase (ubiquinone) flavoprotein subunit